MSEDKGNITRAYCQVGCIGCRICEKNYESGAITVTGSKAMIDYDKCTNCGVCAAKCPRKIIRRMDNANSKVFVSD
jgi:ferredoxin